MPNKFTSLIRFWHFHFLLSRHIRHLVQRYFSFYNSRKVLPRTRSFITYSHNRYINRHINNYISLNGNTTVSLTDFLNQYLHTCQKTIDVLIRKLSLHIFTTSIFSCMSLLRNCWTRVDFTSYFHTLHIETGETFIKENRQISFTINSHILYIETSETALESVAIFAFTVHSHI